MGTFRFNITMSLDGFVAGPHQSVDNPLGVGAMGLHEWAFALSAWRKQHGEDGGDVNASTAVVDAQLANLGAVVMGRNMFGGHPGAWGAEPWNGWWGDDPPFHVPVFVVTHHRREPLTMQGGTTFHFVSDGIEAALSQARRAAAGKDVSLGGGANIAQQYLAAGLLDEMTISLVPRILGAGERLFDKLGDRAPKLEQVRAIEAPGVTHLHYRVLK